MSCKPLDKTPVNRDLKLLHHFSHARHMAATDDQRITIQALEVQLEMPKRRTLQAFNSLASHQRIAMDTHEPVAEFILKRLERLVEQHFAAFVAQRHIFVVGDKIDHLAQRDQLDALTGSGADMTSRAAASLGGRTGECSELDAIGALGFFNASCKCSVRTGFTR